MSTYFSQMGPFQYPMMLLAMAVVGLISWRALQLTSARGTAGPELEAGVNGILFWGCVSALTGFLGLFSGAYMSLTAFGRISDASLRMVALGVAESLSISVFGIGILIVAAVGWFVLRGRYRTLTAAEA